MKKTTLPILDILGENFYIWGHSFSLGQICKGKILNYISGVIFIFWGQFFRGEILNLCVWGKFRFGGFFQFGQFCVWEGKS